MLFVHPHVEDGDQWHVEQLIDSEHIGFHYLTQNCALLNQNQMRHVRKVYLTEKSEDILLKLCLNNRRVRYGYGYGYGYLLL